MTRAWWQFGRREDELSEEMQSHIAMAIQERVARGESLDSATAAARRQFGNREQVRATAREMWGWVRVEEFTTDLKYAFRSLRASPGFLLRAVLSLGLGLGLATSMFVLVDAILNPSIPYGHAERLVFVELTAPGAKADRVPSIGAQLRALAGVQGASRVGAAAFQSGYLSVDGVLRQSTVATLSPEYLALLDIRPRLGRFPTQDEARASNAVVVTDAFWRRRFENRAAIGDARVTFNDRDYTIVGVLPVGADRDTHAAVWIPLASDAALDTVRSATIGIRVAAKTSAATIAPQLSTAATRLGKAFDVRVSGFAVRSASPHDRGRTDAELFLFGAAFAVLGIAGTNVAILMLVRGSSRHRDYALRRAIGATSVRIARDVIAEVVVIASLGTLAGAAVVQMSLGLLRTLVPEQMIESGIRPPEWSMQTFVVLAAGLIVALALAGALPAWRASRTNAADLIKSNAGTTTPRAASKYRFFIVAELSLSMVLALTAATMVHATIKYNQFSYGFEPRRLLRVDVGLPRSADSLNAAERGGLQRDLLTRIEKERGVAAAATFASAQLDGGRATSDGLPPAQPAIPQSRYFEVSPGFFGATGIPIVAGRDFAEGDRAVGGAVILSDRLARSLFPRGNAVGGRVKLGAPQSKGPWITVVGITSDAAMERPFNPNIPTEPLMFALTANPVSSAWSLVVRPATGADKVDVATTRVLRDALSPRVRWSVAHWLDNADTAESVLVFIAQTLGILGLSAVLLAAFGLYGVVSHSVAQRSREFAVRIALGATTRQILQVVLFYGAQLMAVGAVIGVVLSFWSMSVFRAIMFGLGFADPVSMELATAAIVVATLIACLAPAVRATRSDPLEILRAA
jgi:predicted permease